MFSVELLASRLSSKLLTLYRRDKLPGYEKSTTKLYITMGPNKMPYYWAPPIERFKSRPSVAVGISISTRRCWTDSDKDMLPISTRGRCSWWEDDVQRRTTRFEAQLEIIDPSSVITGSQITQGQIDWLWVRPFTDSFWTSN
ncbi:uncharacterized protein ARMOST_18059 [Armillaria ostoyae]|uniref:Uncharacterized protein n=1 Tax=Armillaria ostoyae TaxID=47428 RepID=A0A284S0Y4_ARMOS|nr:uncharacterized protein ARMOST_18059 [Armillaria ostoyae]